MTVKELIERLKEMPDQDEEVYVESYNPYAPVIGEPVFDVYVNDVLDDGPLGVVVIAT